MIFIPSKDSLISFHLAPSWPCGSLYSRRYWELHSGTSIFANKIVISVYTSRTLSSEYQDMVNKWVHMARKHVARSQGSCHMNSCGSMISRSSGTSAFEAMTTHEFLLNIKLLTCRTLFCDCLL